MSHLSRPSRLRPARSTDPVRVYYVLSAVSTFCLTLCFTVNLVFMITEVGLSPLRLVLVGTVLEATCFLAEVPTGVVADRYSRRLSVLIGFALIGCGFLVGSVPLFSAVLFAQVVWGIGFTCTSGATVAWITDEVGEDRLRAILTRQKQLELIAAFAGTMAAGVLSLISVQLPMVLAGAGLLILSAVLTMWMPERHFTPAPVGASESFGGMLATARSGLRLARARTVVRGLLGISVLVGLSSEAFDRLWQLKIIDSYPLRTLPGTDDPALWFAGVALVGIVISLLASLLVNHFGARALAAVHPGGLLAALAVLDVLGIVGVAVSPSLWPALIAVWVKAAAIAVAAPVLSAWLNRQLESSVRATVLSFDSQANAIGQVVGGPPLGWVANRTSVRLALLVSAGLLLPTVAIFWLLGRREGATSARTGSCRTRR